MELLFLLFFSNPVFVKLPYITASWTMKVVGLMSLGKEGKITLSSLTEMAFSQLGKFS